MRLEDTMAAQIRLARELDAGTLAAIYRPIVETTAISFETVAPDSAEMTRRIGDTLRSYPWLVCDVEGDIAGFAYAARHRVRGTYRWSVDTSVYVDAKYRRSGIGRGLYASLFAILAAQGFFNAYAGITLPNPASVALHESVGFKSLGVYSRVGYKLGAWHDVGWWQLTLIQHADAPSEPLDLAAVQRQGSWHAWLSRGEACVRAERIK